MKCWETEEVEVLQEFLKILNKISNDEAIVGYNNLKFDVPFIVGRLNVLGKLTPEIWDLLHNKKWLDLYQYLADDYRSMNRWLKVYGIKRKYEVNGKDIPILFAKKEFKKIEEHAVEDLMVCEQLFNKLHEKYPGLLR